MSSPGVVHRKLSSTTPLSADRLGQPQYQKIFPIFLIVVSCCIFLVNWLLLTIFEFSRKSLADSWHRRFTITYTRRKSLRSCLAMPSFVSNQLAEAPLNQACANIKYCISGLQRSLGSRRFIEHQINYLAKQVELLWLKGHLQQHTFTLLPQH